MANVPQVRRLLAEDFTEQAEWIGPLLTTINQALESTAAALNRSLTVEENFSGRMLTVEVDGTYPLKLSWGLSGRPVSVLVGNCVRSDNSSFTLSTAVQVQWSFNQNGQLQIDNVVGITPTSAEKYKLTLECKTG